jgi:hypothetical protein
LAVFGLVVVLLVVLPVFGFVFGWWGEAAKVAHDEYGPKAMLKKYEAFKDIAAQLEAKLATIQVAEGRTKSMEESYKGKPRSEWDRTDKEQYNVWSSELSGMKASYNSLAAQYNADMAKFNYSFANTGSLPQGAERPLPREFKPYVTN